MYVRRAGVYVIAVNEMVLPRERMHAVCEVMVWKHRRRLNSQGMRKTLDPLEDHQDKEGFGV